MPGDTRLGQTEDAGQFGHVEPLPGEHPEQPKARIVSEEAEERRGFTHIRKSIFIDIQMQGRNGRMAAHRHANVETQGATAQSACETPLGGIVGRRRPVGGAFQPVALIGGATRASD